MKIVQWGNISYETAWKNQEFLFQTAIDCKLRGEKVTNTLIFCEHPHVYTLGKHGKPENMLLSAERLNQLQITMVQTNRGGDITYHGPGQIVGYPIFDLDYFGMGLKQYIYNIEEVIIRTMRAYGIETERMAGATGVWLDVGKPVCRKIAAIGVRSSHYITMHGFALNVNTDLNYFSMINPCGFVDKKATSMQKEMGRVVDEKEVMNSLIKCFNEIFVEQDV